MGLPVLIIGESGSGKSASLRNFEPDEIGVLNVAGKPLPFRKKLKTIDNATYDFIAERLKAHSLKCYAIDDSQYLLAFEFLDKAKEGGYSKFTDMALKFVNLIRFIQFGMPADCIVYFLHHVEASADSLGNRRIKAKTIGKMIDEKITLEGLFSIVLFCKSDDQGRHFFQTQSLGYSTAKSPMDMFPLEIDNDLKAVDTTIREYYNFKTKGE